MTSQPAWDDDWISECLATGEPYYTTRANQRAYADCRWCTHREHGFKCHDCLCESSYTSRDDSWRDPRVGVDFQARQFTHTHGVDGYVAHLICKPSRLGTTQRCRIKHLLEGGSPLP